MKSSIIPPQRKGKHNNLEEEVVFASDEEAINRYGYAKSCLLLPGTWQAKAGILGAGFALFDASGQFLDGNAATGNYIRIDIPGPGPSAGDGYDWVRIEEIREDAGTGYASIAMRVSPAAPPGATGKKAAHFFTEEASSTFVIERKGRKLTAAYHGRNEVINDETDNSADNLRNKLTGTIAKAGLSEAQWHALLKGFIH